VSPGAYLHDAEDPSDHFTIVPNDFLRDPGLTGLEKALGAYIKSHAPGYRLTVTQMVAEFAETTHAIRKALRSLESKGHLTWRQARAEGGRYGQGDRRFRFKADSAATGSRLTACGDTACGETHTSKTRT
jgi:hypothetical protein